MTSLEASDYPPGPVFLTGLFFIALVGALDFFTGTELSFSIFYLVPVSLLTILNGRVAGLIGSGLSAGVWLYADLNAGAAYSNALIPYWNAMVRLGYFGLHTLLLSRLYAAMRSERSSARLDPLTDLANWRHFRELAATEIARARRSGRPLTVAYVDVDDFKVVNDTLGHSKGDQALRAVARTMRAVVRTGDVVARVGGDEFVILLPDTGEAAARLVLERVRSRAQQEMDGLELPVGLSIGAVTYTRPPPDVEHLVGRADAVMYSVKGAGKRSLKLLTMAEEGTDGEAATEGRAGATGEQPS